MAITDPHVGPKGNGNRQEGGVATFLVRRGTDGECAPACDFNRGSCLIGWRHPAGTVPWDPRCRDGDVYALLRVAEGAGEWSDDGPVTQ